MLLIEQTVYAECQEIQRKVQLTLVIWLFDIVSVQC